MKWIGLCSVLRPRQHSIGYMGDGFYRSKDPTNSIKVLKEHTEYTQITDKCREPCISNKGPQTASIKEMSYNRMDG